MKKNVLMIDDNQDLIEIVRELFATTEFNFVSAKDGAEGLLKAKNQKFAVIICDYKMPKVDGEGFITEFRNVMKSDIPLIFYSGALDQIPQSVFKFKNTYKLEKPSQGYELIQRVRSLANAQTHLEPVKALPQYFEAGKVLFKQFEPSSTCYWIKEGVVEIIKELPDGSEVILMTLKAGDFLGYYQPQDERFRTYTARAYTHVQLKEISQAQIEKEIEDKPEWLKALLLSYHSQMKQIYRDQKIKKAS